MLIRSLVPALCVLVLTACSMAKPTQLEEAEERYGVRGGLLAGDKRQFHRILHYPNGGGLQVQGYVVGIEEGNADALGNARILHKEKRVWADWDQHFISHVMAYRSFGNATDVYPSRIRPCALYTALSEAPLDQPLFERCPSGTTASAISPEAPSPKVFERSWDGLRALRSDIEEQRGEFSHIMIFVMGWNTPQHEAIQNINSLVGNLLDVVDAKRVHCPRDRAAAACTFRPLVIGVTWASAWDVNPLIPLPDDASFTFKARDARVIGAGWLRALIKYVALPKGASPSTRPPVVLIGHSFGARALKWAVSDELNVFEPPTPRPVKGAYQRGDHFIALQGAFDYSDIFPGWNADRTPTLFKSLGDGLRMTLTASEFDTAVNLAWGTPFAGSAAAYDRVCKSNEFGKFQTVVTCEPARVLGFACQEPFKTRNPSSHTSAPEHRIRYVDASAVINCGAAFSRMGSHSDIYRRETAEMLWHYINYIPGQPAPPRQP